MVDRRQTEYWNGVSLEIETAIKQHDPATAFATIRRLRGGKERVENMPLRVKTGTMPVNSFDKIERWKEYFQQLLNVDSVADQTLIDQIQPAHISVQEARRQEKPPTINEVQQALNQMKNRRAPGNDNILIY